MAERNALKRQHKAGKVYCTNDEKKLEVINVCFGKVRLIFSMDDRNLLSQFIPSGEKRAGTKKNLSHGWTTMRKDLPKERLLRPSMIRKSAFKMTNLLENVLCA